MDFTCDVVPSTIQERIEVAQKHRLKAEDHINGKYNQKPQLRKKITQTTLKHKTVKNTPERKSKRL